MTHFTLLFAIILIIATVLHLKWEQVEQSRLMIAVTAAVALIVLMRGPIAKFTRRWP